MFQDSGFQSSYTDAALYVALTSGTCYRFRHSPRSLRSQKTRRGQRPKYLGENQTAPDETCRIHIVLSQIPTSPFSHSNHSRSSVFVYWVYFQVDIQDPLFPTLREIRPYSRPARFPRCFSACPIFNTTSAARYHFRRLPDECHCVPYTVDKRVWSRRAERRKKEGR